MPAAQVSLLLRFINIANAAVLGFACFMAYEMVAVLAQSGSVPITRAFLATYIGMFAAMLALFETRVSYTAKCIRRNFGFLFTYTGRACFLIFLGAVCFGMLDEDGHLKAPEAYTTCLLVGIATVMNAALNCFIICNHPEFQAMNAPEEDGRPAAGGDPSKMTEAQIQAYLASHPEVATQVAGATKAGDVHVNVPIGDNDAAAAAPGGAAGGSGAGKGGFFGMFGGGGAGGTSAQRAGAPAAPAHAASASAAYTPPALSAPPTAVYAAPGSYVAPGSYGAPQPPPSSFAIAAEDDNPFAGAAPVPKF
jgi:hypothetical protein